MKTPIRTAMMGWAVLFLIPALRAEEAEWIDYSTLDRWRQPTGDWYLAGDAKLAPENPKRLIGTSGEKVMINGKTGRTRNLYTPRKFKDVEVHLEFMVSRGSNSGVKLMGLYEIQIFDSADVKEPKAHHCGGIYPRAELLPRYHYLDEGVPPKVNAAKKPGEWQTLDVIFHAPRFDESGKKIANAKIVKAVLNDQVIHENVELKTPTGHAWVKKEVSEGPLMLQADHGPVAFRNVKIRPIDK